MTIKQQPEPEIVDCTMTPEEKAAEAIAKAFRDSIAEDAALVSLYHDILCPDGRCYGSLWGRVRVVPAGPIIGHSRETSSVVIVGSGSTAIAVPSQQVISIAICQAFPSATRETWSAEGFRLRLRPLKTEAVVCSSDGELDASDVTEEFDASDSTGE